MTAAPRMRRLPALAVVALPPALAAVAPPPSTCWAVLFARSGTPSVASSAPSSVTAPLVALLALATWACGAWLLVVLAATWGGRLPGLAGRAARRTAERVAPGPVRTLVQVALGATVAASVLGGASSGLADERPAAVASYDWPGTTAGPTETGPAPAPSARPLPAGTRRVAVVVVRPGDSLWAIAARDLGVGAPAARVARAWPRWWAANRDVLGDAPDLIHPGTRLDAPPTTRP